MSVSELGALDCRIVRRTAFAQCRVMHEAAHVLQVLGHHDSLAYESWPEHDESLLVEDSVKLPIQVCADYFFCTA